VKEGTGTCVLPLRSPTGTCSFAAGANFTVSAPDLPHFISTLLYGFNDQDQVLLMRRAKDPNLGCWSPCGGKLHARLGESPFACARREALEEMDLDLPNQALHLTGLVSECGYQGQAHWLMFLFEIKVRLRHLPKPHREGTFQFFDRTELDSLTIPTSDRDQLWPLFWRHRGGFFAAHCLCHPNGQQDWTLEESLPHV